MLSDPWTLAVMLAGVQVSFGLVGWLRIRASAKNARSLARLSAGRPWFALAVGTGAGALAFELTLLYPLALRALLGRSPVSPWDAVSQMPAITRTVLLGFGVLVAPVAEEVFFRGYVLGLFQRAHLVCEGLLVSATLFAAAHFSDPYNLPAIWLIGIVLGWLYHRTGSLLASIAAHMVNNALALTTLFLG